MVAFGSGESVQEGFQFGLGGIVAGAGEAEILPTAAAFLFVL